MGYKVLKSFIDKQTKIGYNTGNTFSSDDPERVSSLSNRGYIEKLKEQVKKDAPKRKASSKNK